MMEQTGGLDLNAGEQELGNTDVAAGLASDPGGYGTGECLAASRDSDLALRERRDASCGHRDAAMDVSVAVASEGAEVGPEVVGCSGAAVVREGLELRKEEPNNVEDKGMNSRLVDRCEDDQKPESDMVDAAGAVVADAEAAVAEDVENVPDMIKPAVKFESSLVGKPNSETDKMAGNLVEGGILTTADESGTQQKVRMDVMETEDITEAAKTAESIHVEEAKGVEAHFPDSEANVVGEKDHALENENRAVLRGEGLSHKGKEESAVNGTMGCDSIDGHLHEKSDVLDSAASEMEDGSSCTHKPEVSAVDAECVVENAATLTATAFDRDDVQRSVDASNPGVIQVDVSLSVISNQTEVEEGHLSHKDENQLVAGQLQPEEGAAGSIACEAEKKSCDDEKPEAGLVNSRCPLVMESSAYLTGMEAENLEGLRDQVDEEVGVMEISDRSEPTGEVVSCPENANLVANHDPVDEHLDATTEVDLGANALEAGCTMEAAEADPAVAFVGVEAESTEGIPDQGRAQVEVTETSNESKLPGHAQSFAEKKQSLLNELVSHVVVDGHLYATEGVLVPGVSDQNGALILESSVSTSETKDDLSLGINQDEESEELDGKTDVCELSMMNNDQDRASVLEMSFINTSQIAQDEINAIYQKELQGDPHLDDDTAIDQIHNDRRDSEPTNPIVELNITATNVQVRKEDSGNIHLLNDDPVDSGHSIMGEMHLVEKAVCAETETDDLEVGGKITKYKEYTAVTHDVSVSNPPVMMPENCVTQLVGDYRNEKGDATVPSSGLILEEMSLDGCSADGEFVMDGLNLSVEISMPRTSELPHVGNVVYSGIESVDPLVSKNQETESQTVRSLSGNNHSPNAIGANSSLNRGQNMLAEFKVLKEDECPTTEFCQNAEIGRDPEADEKYVVLGENAADVGSDAGTNDDHMAVDEQEPAKGADKHTVKQVATRPGASGKDNDQCACYYLPSKDEDGFSISDLVWGKVKSHPWWPGQIFDPSDASDLALKYQKKDNFLVAYFGDKTFAWCDESQLKHFETYFSQMENQSSSDVFVAAVNGTLDEVSRRMGLGMTCICLPEATNVNISNQRVENAGIREGSNGYALDRSAILSYFQPVRLLDYVKALAKFPNGIIDRLELVIAHAQLKAFYRSKGYPELPSFQFGDGLSEIDAEISHSRFERMEEDTIEQSSPALSDLMPGKQKSRGRGSSLNKQKHVLEDGKKQKGLSELMETEGYELANGAKTECGLKADLESLSFSSSKKHKFTDSDSSDSGKGKKKRLDSLGDMEIKLPPPSITSSFKVGECIRRVASQLTGSSPVPKTHSETSLKNVPKDDSIFDVFISDGFSDSIMQSPRFKQEDAENYSSPDEMLSQLCLAAADPVKGYSYLSVITSFFTEFRNYCVSGSANENKYPEKAGVKRERKRKADVQSGFSEIVELDHMQDSFWSDLISHNIPAKNKGETQTRSQRRKRKTSGETSTLTLVPVLQGAERLQVGIASPNMKQAPLTDWSIISVEGKMVDECTPTALILNFNGSKSLPSETDLIRIFSRYGPLKEAATEVQQKNNRVKVVFKRRADAEMAFSSAGKYSIFGPSLLSYRLRYLPSTPDTSPDTKQTDQGDALLVESSNLEIPGNLHSSMSGASINTDLQEKIDSVLAESSNTNILHPSMPIASPDANLQEESAVLTGSSNTNIPSNLHPSVTDAPLDTSLQSQTDVALTGSSNTNILHPSISNAPPDTNIQEESTVVAGSGNTSLPSNLDPSATQMSGASIDTDLQGKSDSVLAESSNANILHPSMSDASPDTNIHEESAVLTGSSNTNIPSNLLPLVTDAPLDTSLQSQTDVAVTGSNNTNILHPSMSNASQDTNLQEESTVLTGSGNTSLPGNLDPSATQMSGASIDTDLQGKNDSVLAESNNANILHPSMSDASPDTNIHEESAVLTGCSNTNIPSNLHPSVTDAPLDTILQSQIDAALTGSSNTNIPSDLLNTNLQNQIDAAAVTGRSNTSIPSDLHPALSVASLCTNLQEKSDMVQDINLQDKSDAVLMENSNLNIPSQLHPLTSDASIDGNPQDESNTVLVERSDRNLPSNLHVSAIVAAPDTVTEDKSDATLTENSNMDISAQAEREVLDTMQIVSEEPVAGVAEVDEQAS